MWDRAWWLLVIVICYGRVVGPMGRLVAGGGGEVVSCRGRGVGRAAAGRGIGVHSGEARGHGGRPGHELTQRLLDGVGVAAAGHRLAGLQTELEVGQPLLVLLSRHVYPGLLAGVELGVADPAVVLQGAGQGRAAHQTPGNTQCSVSAVINTHHDLPPLSRLATGIRV